MTAYLAMWGNSLGLRLPKPFAEQLGLKEGSAVSLTVEHGRLVISPAEPTLEALVSRVTPENIHSEFDFGKPVGHEAW